MKDPIIEEIQKIRQEHASKFGHNLKMIYEDLKRLEANCGYDIVRLAPKMRTSPLTNGTANSSNH